ncbi:hypothetical protein GDO86_009096 [Hymenochirus boettgeri]|uniref:Uncharacterized protein n=1 Tax=Hymenochirus boettgeri TaxID=247094 RepID=A0A8T2JJQ8_9PIPI|nr:hypothetical protein GDO86_009096 [Hymenochirus boettgeri]
MAGGSRLKRRRKNKYRKLNPGKVEVEGAEKQDKSGESQTPPQDTVPQGKKKRSSKKVHVAPLPDRYDPLVEGAEEPESKQEKSYRKKQKVKKYAKNVGKAVRAGCRYLLIGIQGLANAYAAPFAVSSVVLSSMAR